MIPDQFWLTDEQWASIAPHLPTNTRGKATSGRPARDQRHRARAQERWALEGLRRLLRAEDDDLQSLRPLGRPGVWVDLFQGGNQRVEFAERILDLAPVELDQQVALGLIDAEKLPEIAVEHLAVVVVLSLHHLIAGREARPEAFDLLGHVRVEGLLEIGVERPVRQGAALHRAEDLHVPMGSRPKRRGMRSRTISTTLAAPFSGSLASTK